MKLINAISIVGACVAVALHVLALSGRTIGGEFLLMVMFAGVFLCFGSAILRGGFRSIEERKPRLDLSRLVPPWLNWGCLVFIAYGFLFGFSTGKVSHQFGEVLTPEKAAVFYATMISFFSMAVLIHVALSAKKPPNQSLQPTGASARG